MTTTKERPERTFTKDAMLKRAFKLLLMFTDEHETVDEFVYTAVRQWCDEYEEWEFEEAIRAEEALAADTGAESEGSDD